MNALEQPKAVAPITREKVEAVEARLLQLPQVDCSLRHRFGPGIYIREVTIPAGALAIGHHHKHAHMNIMVKGRLTFLMNDGATMEVCAPFIDVCSPGRKIAFAHEETVWLNVYATNETDTEALEEKFFEKSHAWMLGDAQRKALEALQRTADREDYTRFLQEYGWTREAVLAVVRNEGDQVPMPRGDWKFTVAESQIDGRGVFATSNIEAHEVIGPARIDTMRTPLGRYTNHAANPNAVMRAMPNGNIELVAVSPIAGYRGGQRGDEITVNYRQAVNVKGTIICQP